MSRSARFSGVFGDGKHDFLLTIGGLEELQEKCDAGPEEIWSRVLAGGWRVADLREPIRIGLIGGGMEPIKALVMVERYAGAGALSELKPLVANIIGAALVGAVDEDGPPGKPKRRSRKASPAAS
jgi:hypothetical protein